MDTHAIEDLNSLLEDELSAVQAYEKVIAKLNRFADKDKTLAGALDSHRERAKKLRGVITEMGGNAISDLNLGGKLAKLVIDGIGQISPKAMVTALSEDEGGWTSDYEWRLVAMKGNHREMVKEELFPQQQKTEEQLREMANAANNGLWPPACSMKDI